MAHHRGPPDRAQLPLGAAGWRDRSSTRPVAKGRSGGCRIPIETRGLPTRSILDRCNATKTCPKIIEHFGSAEIWGLKLGPEWVGTNPKEDIPLPDNVRRYYIASTIAWWRRGRVRHQPARFRSRARSHVECPGNNDGIGVLPANPVPHTETVNALTVHFRNWVMHNTPPPASRYPTLRESQLVEPTKAAMGFPTIPGLRPTAPEPGFINPLLDYDWGPGFDPNDGSGVPSNAPPPIKQVIKMLVPKVDADGNEIGGVPVVLRDAPLGTYLGWNITASGTRPFHKDQALQVRRQHYPVRKNQSRTHGQQRPAVVTGRALYRPRGLRHGGQKSRGQRSCAEVSAAEGCRCADRRGGCE